MCDTYQQPEMKNSREKIRSHSQSWSCSKNRKGGSILSRHLYTPSPERTVVISNHDVRNARTSEGRTRRTVPNDRTSSVVQKVN